MAWRRPVDKPLFEPMLVNLVTHVYAPIGLNEFLNVEQIIGNMTQS